MHWCCGCWAVSTLKSTKSFASCLRAVASQGAPLLPTTAPLQLSGMPQRLSWAWLARLLQRTAAAAPGPTEANLSEQMRRAAAQPKGATAEIMGRYMPEVLQVSATLRV